MSMRLSSDVFATISLLDERAHDESNRRVPGRRLVHGLRMRIPVAVHGPEEERLEHDARRDRRVGEAAESTAARAVVEIAIEERQGAVRAGPVPELREIGVVEGAAIEELDPVAMAGERVVQLAQDVLELVESLRDT